jgi:hypothetical protein
MEFAADARLFIAELDGLLKVFDGIDDSTPDIARDLRDQVHSVDGRGLFGIALDAGFPSGHHRQQLRNVASPVRIEHVPPPNCGLASVDDRHPGGRRNLTDSRRNHRPLR